MILPDRDKVRRFYLDADVTHVLHNGHILEVGKGYRFDGHSVKTVRSVLIGSAALLAALYFIPTILFYVLCAVVALSFIGWTLTLIVLRAFDAADIRAALIHDALLDLAPWHRYPRKFIDHEYEVVMQKVSYGWRKKLMPLAVKIWGFIVSKGWTDYRGDYNKYQTKVSVKVAMVK